ncbi:MAG: hypothetical protein WCH44_11930 [Betaproteobacteria bacterium]
MHDPVFAGSLRPISFNCKLAQVAAAQARALDAKLTLAGLSKFD